MYMKRFWLALLCCSPLLFSTFSSYGLVLTGPNGEQQSSDGQYGPITEIETLWAISSTLKPSDSVSVQQTLVAIYKLNPNVFYQKNINKLIPGSFIQVPTLAFVQQQTTREAIALINRFSKPKKTPIKAVQPKPTPSVVKKEPVVTPSVEKTPVIEDSDALNELQNNLKSLQQEYDTINEELISETERNQELKLRLQPLYDQISSLEAQVNQSLENQVDMQKVIDDLRAQLAAVNERPFNGPGLFNKVLRTITASLTNLLITLITPILLLLGVFALILRINSKRALEKQAQELADSTDISMEEPGKFDDLLTDDFPDTLETDPLEVDFNEDEELMKASDQPVAEDAKTISLEDEIDDVIDLAEDDLANEMLSEEEDVAAIAILPDDENDEDLFSTTDLSETDDDDPFGIAALAEEEAPEADEDDPFGISALIDDNALSDPEEPIEDKDDPFGISGLTEQENLIPEDVIEKVEAISESEQADLDLAAEWERQLSGSEEGVDELTLDQEENEDSETSEVIRESEALDQGSAEVENNQDDIDDIEFDNIADSDIADNIDDIEFDNIAAPNTEEEADDVKVDSPDVLAPETIDKDADEIEFDNIAAPDAEEEVDDIEFDNIAAPDTEEEVDDINVDSPDVLAPETIDKDADEIAFDNIADLDTEDDADEIVFDNIAATDNNEIDKESEPDSIEDAFEEIDLDDLDLTELENAEPINIEEALAELDLSEAQEAEQQEAEDSLDKLVLPEQDEESEPDLEDDPNDLLAKQLSDVAFKGDGALPKVDKSVKDDFIDIETLLEGSNHSSTDEPYSEFDLDLGLDDFPDVINATSNNVSEAENEISAQLDLARAYLEIDDKAGAKEILLAVQSKSEGGQKAEIEKLLSRIG